MKIKPLLFVLASATALAAWATDAPKIDEKRIDIVVEQYQATGGQVPPEQKDAIRSQIRQDIQRSEVLKNAALQAGLDKKPEVKMAYQNFEAQFYAAQYFEHLKKTLKVKESDLHQMYARMAREVKIQMAAFKTEEEVKAAQEKLLKGMSFTDLLATLPEQPASPPDFISPQMLPPEFAQVIDGMDKGKISTKAVEFQGQLYLIKVADTRKGDKMPPFPQVRDRLLAQYKDKLVREKVEKLFAEHGLSVTN